MSRVLLCALLMACFALPSVAAAQGGPPTLPSDDEIFGDIEAITAKGPRRLGTEGGRHAVSFVKRKFEQHGLQDVHVEETPAWSWTAKRVEMRYGGRPIDVQPAIYSQSPSARATGDASTPPGGLEAPLVDIGGGTPEELAGKDVEGKIALFDLEFLLPLVGLLPFSEFLWDPQATLVKDPKALTTANPYITNYSEAVKAAQDAGAIGFVGVLGDYFDSNDYYNEFYRRLVVRIPGMWVTRGEGARLRAQLATDPSTPAQVVFESRREEVPASAVIGFLPGRSSDAIMVQSHHDSAWVGAVEDGSGVAEVLALAAHYGKQPASSREKTLMFVTFDSHFSGYQAHFAFTRRHLLDRDPARDPNRIVANVTLEHIGKAATIGDDGQLEVSELPEARGIFENFNPGLKAELIEGIVRHDLQRTALLNGTALQPLGIPTDASFAVVAGVPTASLIAGPLYLYDKADTLDKVLKDDLRDMAALFVDFIDALDASDSETIGVIPLSASLAVGRQAAEQVTGERGTEVSTDRVEEARTSGCVPVTTGRAVAALRLRREGAVTRLSFRARRTQRVRIAVRHRDGRTAALQRLRQVRGCRRYQVRLPRSVRSVRITGRGGAVAVSRR